MKSKVLIASFLTLAITVFPATNAFAQAGQGFGKPQNPQGPTGSTFRVRDTATNRVLWETNERDTLKNPDQTCENLARIYGAKATGGKTGFDLKSKLKLGQYLKLRCTKRGKSWVGSTEYLPIPPESNNEFRIDPDTTRDGAAGAGLLFLIWDAINNIWRAVPNI
jgi:hypothetical protein